MIDMRGAPEYYGWAYTFITLATLFWSLYAGTLIDKYSRKRIFMGLNLAGLFVMGSVATFGFFSDTIPDALVMLAFASTIFVYNIHYPALYALGQELTEPKNYGKINSTFEVQGQSTTILAGGLAALLLEGTANISAIKEWFPFEIEPWEIHEIFAIDACTYGIAFVLISCIRYSPIKTATKEVGNVLQRFKTGLRFLKENVPILWFGLATYAIFVTLIVQAFYLMANYISAHLEEGAWLYASGEMIYAGGALLAGVFVRRIFAKVSTVKAILIMMVMTVVIYVVVAFTAVNAVFMVFCLLLGIANAGTRVLRITWLFNVAPNQVIGRINSIFNAFNILMRTLFLAAFSLPFFTSKEGIPWAYFILGVFVLVATIPLFSYSKELSEKQE